MNSYLIHYQPYINVLFFFGVAHVRVEKNSTLVVCPKFRLIYATIVSLIISTLWSISVYCLMKYSRKLGSSTTYRVAEYSQYGLTIFIYVAVIVTTINNRQILVIFLNRLHMVDLEIQIKLQINKINRKADFVKTYFWNFLITVCILIMNFIFEILISIDWPNRLGAVIMCFIRLSIFLIILHIKWLANMLTRRFLIIQQTFVKAVRSKDSAENLLHIFNLIEIMWTLIKLFERNFGFVILLNFTFDFCMFTVYLYTLVYFTIFNVQLHVGYIMLVVCACLLPHLLSCVYVVMAVSDLGNQV